MHRGMVKRVLLFGIGLPSSSAGVPGPEVGTREALSGQSAVSKWWDSWKGVRERSAHQIVRPKGGVETETDL